MICPGRNCDMKRGEANCIMYIDAIKRRALRRRVTANCPYVEECIGIQYRRNLSRQRCFRREEEGWSKCILRATSNREPRKRNLSIVVFRPLAKWAEAVPVAIYISVRCKLMLLVLTYIFLSRYLWNIERRIASALYQAEISKCCFHYGARGVCGVLNPQLRNMMSRMKSPMGDFIIQIVRLQINYF